MARRIGDTLPLRTVKAPLLAIDRLVYILDVTLAPDRNFILDMEELGGWETRVFVLLEFLKDQEPSWFNTSESLSDTVFKDQMASWFSFLKKPDEPGSDTAAHLHAVTPIVREQRQRLRQGAIPASISQANPAHS